MKIIKDKSSIGFRPKNIGNGPVDSASNENRKLSNLHWNTKCNVNIVNDKWPLSCPVG